MRKPLAAALLLLLACVGFAAEAEMRFTAPKKWALVIGASNYGTMGRLRFAAKDAKVFADCLIKDLDFAPSDVKLLVDGGDASIAPNAKNVLAALDETLADETLDRGDLFVFYFSGHGVGTPKGDFLAPTDATMENVEKVGIPLKAITERFVKKKLRNVLIIADACRAGNENPFGKELQELGRQSNLAVLLSCAPGKRSYELPRLQQGAFTYNLLKALRDPSSRDKYFGGLWATAVADKVKEGTFKDTERDYAEYAQVPVAWSEKAMDVLLASFVPESISPDIQKHFNLRVQEAKTSPKQKFHAISMDLAVYIAQAGFFDYAVRQLKTIDEISPLSERELLFLASCQMLAGREVEATRTLDAIIVTGGPYFKACAISAYPTDKYSLAQKADAAEQLFKSEKAFAYAEGAIAFSADRAGREPRIKRLLALVPAGSKEAIYFQARLAYERGKLDAAKPLFAKSAAMPGDEDATHHALFLLDQICMATGDFTGRLAVFEQGVKLKRHKVQWALRYAEVLRDVDRNKTLYLLSVFLDYKNNPTPDDIWEAVKIAGLEAKKLKDHVKWHADFRFASWKIQAAYWICQFLDKPTPFKDLPPSITNYALNQADVRDQAYFTLWRALGEQENFTLLQKRVYGEMFVASLMPLRKEFARDDDTWRNMIEWSMPSVHFTQVYRAAQAELFPLVLSGKESPKLTSQALKIAMNYGDDEMADRLYKLFNWSKLGDEEEDLRYCLYLACRGRTAEAAKLFPKVKVKSGNKGYGDVYRGLKLLLDARAGKAKEVQAELDKWEASSDLGLSIRALVAATVKNSVGTNNVLTVCADYYYPEWYFLTAACLIQLDTNLKASGTADHEENRKGWVWLHTAYRGNPLFERTSYLPNPTIAAYAGKQLYKVHYRHDAIESKDDLRGSISLDIDEKGNVSAVFKPDKGEEVRFTGKVDQFGNLQARSAQGDELAAKIATREFSFQSDMIRQHSQPFLILDRDLRQLTVHGEPQKI